MNRLGGAEHGGGPFRLNVAKVRVPLTAVLAAWLGKKAADGLGWLVRRPVAMVPPLILVVLATVWHRHGTLPILLLAGGTVAGLGLWRCWWPESFTIHVVWRARGMWRGRWTYRYCWQPAMVTTGLAVVVDGREYLPKVRSVRSTGGVDLVRVRMLPGHTMEDWTDAGPRLAQTFDAQECRVRSVPG